MRSLSLLALSSTLTACLSATPYQTDDLNIAEVAGGICDFIGDATTLYIYACQGGIFSCPMTGCSSPKKLASTDKNVAALAVDDDSVYWLPTSIGGSIMRAPKTGGEGTVMWPGSSPATGGEFCGIAVDAGYVYWTNCDPTGAANGLWRIAKQGGSTSYVAFPHFSGMAPRILVDADWIYWVSQPTLSAQSSLCRISTDPAAAAAATCSSDTFASNVPNNESSWYRRGLTEDADSVYWVSGWADGAIHRTAKSDLSALPMAIPPTSTSTFGPMAVDDTHLYWLEILRPVTNSGAGSARLRRADKQGAGGTTTVTNAVDARGFVLRAGSYVYWSMNDRIFGRLVE